MRISSLRQSPAMVVAVVALVAAVAGTAVADPGASTSKITKAKVKKVANKQINKRIPWKTADIADGAITAPKLGTLTVRQSALTTVPADGAPGNGLSQARNAEATCNAGEIALSGGVSDIQPEADGAQPGLTVYGTRYVTTAGRPTGIRARVGNDFPADITFRVEVLCLAG
jgi:hypothetical protein